MNKWYRPLGFLLLASVAGEVCGCAQSGSWLARRESKKGAEEALAEAGKGKKGSKGAKGPAELKSDEPRTLLGKAKRKSKSAAAESKLAAADQVNSSKSSKSSPETAVAKASKDSLASKAAATAKSVAASAKTEEMDAFLSDLDKPTPVAKSESGKQASDEFDPFDDVIEMGQKSVMQVKKELGKKVESLENDVADWASDEGESSLSAVTSAKASTVVDVLEKELDLPLAQPPALQAESEDAGEDGLSQLPSLGDLKKAAIQTIATRGLAKLCPDASGPLAEALNEVDPSDPQSLKVCLSKIGKLGADGIAAAPALQSLLKHDDGIVRTTAAQTMAKLNISSPESIKVVTDSVVSRDANLRSFASGVLDEMGGESTQVLKSLSENLKSTDGQTRLRVAEVLIRHEEYAYPALQTILTSLGDRDSNVRWLATYSLAELAPESPAAVQALVKATHDPVSKVQVGAVYALGEMGPYAKNAGPDLHKLLETSTDAELKEAIVSSLEQIEK